MLRAERDYHISMQTCWKRLSHKHAKHVKRLSHKQNMLRAERDYHISMQTC